jgi:hypothetical protein
MHHELPRCLNSINCFHLYRFSLCFESLLCRLGLSDLRFEIINAHLVESLLFQPRDLLTELESNKPEPSDNERKQDHHQACLRNRQCHNE